MRKLWNARGLCLAAKAATRSTNNSRHLWRRWWNYSGDFIKFAVPGIFVCQTNTGTQTLLSCDGIHSTMQYMVLKRAGSCVHAHAFSVMTA